MQFLIECAIFDDFDVCPTLVIGLFDSSEPPVELIADEFIKFLGELRAACEAEYQRPAPDHALFWHCTPRPDDL